MISRLILTLSLLLCALTGCSTSHEVAAVPANDAPAVASPRHERFVRFFGWGQIRDEATARQFRDIGITDITVSNQTQLELANQYGMRGYLAVGGKGVYLQRMTEEEQQLQRQLNGGSLPDLEKHPTALQRATRKNEIADLRRSMNYRWGGEPDSAKPQVMVTPMPCFLGPGNLQLAFNEVEEKARTPGIAGLSFDFFGYGNYHGCYCDACLSRRAEYIRVNQLKDTPTNRDAFHLQELVDYNNALVDRLKSINPDLKVMAHVYPVFLPEPLYGNRLKVDYCGQTVAWFFPWDEAKIRSYSRTVIDQQNRHHPGVAGVPFAGYYQESGNFPRKDAARIEMELRAILESGSDMIMVSDVNHIIRDPEVAAVFRKYCVPPGMTLPTK